MIDKEEFAKYFNAVSNVRNSSLLELFYNTCKEFDIDTKLRVQHFLAQLSHESGGFAIKFENLNYSAQGLLKIFGKYFNEQTSKVYARKPAMIASRVYANRLGNGDEASQDGWKYRGRGFIQLTGKSNYNDYSHNIFGNSLLVREPDLAARDDIAVKIACIFWNNRNLSQFADKDDVLTVTRRINGGTNGLAHRRELLKKMKSLENK